jgi:hypothetical protein
MQSVEHKCNWNRRFSISQNFSYGSAVCSTIKFIDVTHVIGEIKGEITYKYLTNNIIYYRKILSCSELSLLIVLVRFSAIDILYDIAVFFSFETLRQVLRSLLLGLPARVMNPFISVVGNIRFGVTQRKYLATASWVNLEYSRHDNSSRYVAVVSSLDVAVVSSLDATVFIVSSRDGFLVSRLGGYVV